MCVLGRQWRMGVLAGAAAAMASAGALLALLGLPLNRNLYSGSYILITGGLAGEYLSTTALQTITFRLNQILRMPP